MAYAQDLAPFMTPEFEEAIDTDVMEAMPCDDSEYVSPYMVGVLDAEQGRPCVPEYYFTQRGQICEYAEGYEIIAGKNLTTGFYLGHDYHVGMSVNWTPCGEYGRVATVVEDIMPIFGDKRICIEVYAPDGAYVRRVRRSQLVPLHDTVEYVEDQADREWWARGSW